MAFCALRRLGVVPLRQKYSFLSVNLNYSSDVNGSKEPETKITHTGQQWDKDDVRNVRFLYGPKQINEHFAIDLIDEIPPKPVKERVTSCNGGGGALGHPKVYINLDQPGPQACGYCGLRFVLEKGHH